MDKLGNLTIILSSYKCDKNCPFCIAKNNNKFKSKKENFDILKEQLEKIKKSGIKFERLVLSGNGEPSLYNLEELEKVAKIIKDNEDVFDMLRIHTSGNIFFEKEKFNLFNNLVSNIEFDILRCAINSEDDMQALGYNRDYIQTEEFKKAKRIKLDIGLTKKLETNKFSEDLENLLNNNSNIGLIRFKNLMCGENKQSKQAKWVKENRMNKDEFMKFANNLISYCGSSKLNNLQTKNGTKIILENSGNYPKDVVYNNGFIRNYEEQPIDILKMKKMASKVDNTKTLNYDFV